MTALTETTKQENSILNLALQYAEKGYKIFPVQEDGKVPATKNGFQDSTTSVEEIERWWNANPNYNVGLPMALNGLVAIDIDMHGDTNGFDVLEACIISSGLSALPSTVEAITANEGKHKIYKAPENFKPVSQLAKGVDVKYNGYILVAPSKIDSKQYEWVTEQGLLDMQAEQLPEDWINHLSRKNYSEKTEVITPSGVNYPPSNAEKVAKNCNFIQHCIDDSKNLSEPDWKFGLVSVISFCQDGEKHVHRWSESYNNYSHEETEEKINDALKFSKPTTCAGIQANCGDKYCESCIHDGKIKSPIVLGYPEKKLPTWDINFPIEVFPQEIQDFILNASHVMDAPKEYFASSILAVAAFLINSQAFIKVKKIGWEEPAVLWLMLVGEAGKKKKSPVYKLIKSILDNIDETLEQEHKEAVIAYRSNILKYKMDLKAWKDNGDSSINPPQEPQEPVRTLIYTSDTTIEAISYHQSRNPHGIGVMRDELAGFFEGFGKYKNGSDDRPYYLSSFIGDEHVVTRKSEGAFKVKPYHNIFGTIQPPVISNLLFKDLRVFDGFTERFLFSLTNYVKQIKIINDEIDEQLKNHVDNLMLSLYKNFNKDGKTTFTLDNEADAELKMLHLQIDAETLNDNNNELLQSYLVKSNTYLPRFTLILHCLKDFTNPNISKNTVQDAYKVVKYFVNCFRTLTVESIELNSNTLEHDTIDWLKARGIEEITPSALHLSNKSKYKKVEIAKECLFALAKSGFGKVVKTENGGYKWQKTN